MNVILLPDQVSALARRNLERVRATPEARAGDFEIIADVALAFVREPQFLGEDRYHFGASCSVFSSKLIFTS